MSWDEEILRNDILAPGANEPHRAPIVVDAGVLARHEKKARYRRLASVDQRDHGGKEVPMGIVAAAVKAPNPKGTVATIHRHGPAGRSVGSCGNGAGLSPEFVLGLAAKGGHQPLMHGREPIDPSR